MTKHLVPQIKICGLTTPAAAVSCADLGVHAIGCVFFPKSPRHLSDDIAKKICRAVLNRVQTVGVFVNEAFDVIMKKVNTCGLSAAQLHGTESPELVVRLRNEGITVIKTLFINRSPGLEDAPSYNASAFLVEHSGGALPGGNADTWDWGKAKAFARRYPCILAGGLSARNVGNAIQNALPGAVDVSSGVESAPGQKNIHKIKEFISSVSAYNHTSDRHLIFPALEV